MPTPTQGDLHQNQYVLLPVGGRGHKNSNLTSLQLFSAIWLAKSNCKQDLYFNKSNEQESRNYFLHKKF